MKKLVKTYFSEDIMSAVFALVIFLCAATIVVSHLFLGLLTVGSFLFELVLVVGAYGLVWAVYTENKRDAEQKNTVK